MLDFAHFAYRCETVGAGAQFARRLRAPQQQLADDGPLGGFEVEVAELGVAEAMPVASDTTTDAAAAVRHQVLFHQPVEDVLDLAAAELEHGVAIAFLVARYGQRIERQRILIWRRDFFLDEAADDAGFQGGQLCAHFCSPRTAGVRSGSLRYKSASRKPTG